MLSSWCSHVMVSSATYELMCNNMQSLAKKIIVKCFLFTILFQTQVLYMACGKWLEYAPGLWNMAWVCWIWLKYAHSLWNMAGLCSLNLAGICSWLVEYGWNMLMCLSIIRASIIFIRLCGRYSPPVCFITTFSMSVYSSSGFQSLWIFSHWASLFSLSRRHLVHWLMIIAYAFYYGAYAWWI